MKVIYFILASIYYITNNWSSIPQQVPIIYQFYLINATNYNKYTLSLSLDVHNLGKK